MFRILGNLVARLAPVWLALWLLVGLASWYLSPPWNEVVRDEEIGFLPERMPSRRGEEQIARAFPEGQPGSSVVLIVQRRDGPTGFSTADSQFLGEVLEPGLRRIAEAEGGLAWAPTATEVSPFETQPDQPSASPSIIGRIRTPHSPGVGALLVSEDGQAWLVVVELTTEFLARGNRGVIDKIERFVAGLQEPGQLPDGREIYLTGSAVLGRDRLHAQYEGARVTEGWTVLLIVALLLLIYRAPLLAAIPLLTVFLAVRLALHVLSILAGAGYVTLFEGLQVYTTVVAYGAGVDYCLFLTARYQEELDRGAAHAEAMARSVGAVGGALTASAATVMGGIGMMTFAEFGKLRQAGIAMPLAILLVLLATLTFAAPLMRICGRWAFWPRRSQDRTGPRPAWAGALRRRWQTLAQSLLRAPGRIWLVSVALLAPAAVAGVRLQDHLTYDLIGGLPADATSSVGTRVLQQHFPAGLMGPVTVLLVNPDLDFASPAGEETIAQITAQLGQHRGNGLADLRTLTAPLGLTPAAQRAVDELQLSEQDAEEALRRQALAHYVTDFGERKNIGARLELILAENPFAVRSIELLADLEAGLLESLPAELRQDTDRYVLGPTASIRDLRRVKNSDQARIEALVLAIVFLILVLLFRALVPAYLILSVLFTYYATLGAAFVVFGLLTPGEFAGLDWKVSIFLFTILIAVGEDYNIFLMTRVTEEQRRHGSIRGVTAALVRTGPIISSCGLIMAGTFASLMAGSLAEMKQLGFALAFGVLLDTFVVRPILVPAFLIQHYRRLPGGSHREGPLADASG